MSEVLVPRTLEEALALRAARPEALPVAGGTDAWVAVNAGRLRPPALLDLSRVGELRRVEREESGVLVGAGVTFARVARELADFRPLAQAARTVGSPQIRNRATVGGNVGTASPAGDSLPVLLAYDADVVLGSVRGVRRLPLARFLLGPKRTALGADELILGLAWRRPDGPGVFAKVGTRNAMVIAVAGLCLQLDAASRRVRLALGSVAPTVVRAREAEELAAAEIRWDEPGRPLAAATGAEVAYLAAAAASPIDDVRGTAAYRRHAVEVLTRRALDWTLAERRERPC